MSTIPATTNPMLTVEVPGHGTYACTAEALDSAIGTRLPASRASLRAEIEDRTGTRFTFEEVSSLSVMLIILADIGPAN
jgi:hypothetical protein